MRHLVLRLATNGAGVAALAALVALSFVGSFAEAQTARGSGPDPSPVQAPSQAPEPGWKTSPFHGVIGGDGNVIPCRCLYRGQSYRLGERVCMNTHVGTVLAECDLQLNNTSWVPTSEACTVS